MAASLLLRRGRAGALKVKETLLLEAPAFRGFASTVSLCAESGKNEKGVPPGPKKQSPPKNVVAAKERGKLLTPPTAAALSKGGALAGPQPGGSMLPTDEGLPKRSTKTLVEFPQKVPSPFQEQGSDAEARRVRRKVTDASSSSSSSSSSSDSESDDEGAVSKVGAHVVSKGKGRLPKSEAARPFESRAPQMEKETSRAQKPHADITSPQQPRQPKKTGTPSKPAGDRKEARPIAVTARSHASTEEQLQRVVPAVESGSGSQKPAAVKEVSPDRARAGSSQPRSGPGSTAWAEEAGPGAQLPCDPGARGGHAELHGPEPGHRAASPLVRGENLGRQGTEGHAATEEVSEDRELGRSAKTVPVPREAVGDQKPAGRRLEGRQEGAEATARPTEAHDSAQEPAPAPEPAEPADATTYKNLQHHSYNTYTFLDLNLALAQLRMPQPSSGRESPRH